MRILKENYYDILEINKNASSEIIEKAYKTLVKKYHPDLQKNNLKNNYEEKIKKINEAYETLSNPVKRKNYDLNLKNNEISLDDYNNLYNEYLRLKNELNYLKNNTKYNANKIINNNNNYKYYNRYFQNLKDKNYKINFQKIATNLLSLFITILIILIICLILWQIPFTRNYLFNLYNDNPILKLLIDLFLNIFK